MQWLGVISIAIGLIIFLLQRRTKKPRYSTKSSVIAADSRSATRGLEVSFRGKKLTRICITKVVIWNSGNTAIRKEDIPTNRPVRVTAKDGAEILDAEVLQMNNLSSYVKCDFASGAATIHFDFLSPQNGFVLNIVHTGKTGSDLKIEAAFIDSKPLRRVPVFESSLLSRISPAAKIKNIRVLRSIMFWSFIIVGALPLSISYFSHSKEFSSILFPGIMVCVMYWGMAAMMFYFRIPSGLDSYFE